LWTEDGDVLDQYIEGGESSWGLSTLRKPEAPTAELTALRIAIEHGESDRVEFKAWMPLDRSDPKSVEFLETAVAFANAKGGTIFIGVNDNGDVAGVERQLFSTFKKQTGRDLAAARDRYAQSLRNTLNFFVYPSLRSAFRWINWDNVWVLAVDIEAGKEPPYGLQDSNQFFVRRGATNRRMSRSDYEMAFRGSSSVLDFPSL
jgi:predicted HTH transcriptional regulator